MTVAEIISKRNATVPPPAPVVGGAPAQGRALMARVGPVLITLTTAATAEILGWAMWDVYMTAPWTRDATVRASVVMIAPEVSGRIVELNVIDNQYVQGRFAHGH